MNECTKNYVSRKCIEGQDEADMIRFFRIIINLCLTFDSHISDTAI